MFQCTVAAMASPNCAQVSATEDDHTLEATLTTSETISQVRSSTVSHIEQARGLSWTDPFCGGKHGIVPAFDRDVESAAMWFG